MRRQVVLSDIMLSGECLCCLEPEKRRWGSFGYVGILTMLGCTLQFAARQLKLVK